MPNVELGLDTFGDVTIGAEADIAKAVETQFYMWHRASPVAVTDPR